MIPKTLSASSVLVSEACMERWKVESFWRTPQSSSEPANVGTSVHFALEQFVKAVHLDQTMAWTDVSYLNEMYQLGYIQTFGTTDTNTETFADGAALVAKWYDWNKDGLPNKVISCEVKENFPVKTSAGEIPFNFIWDRADQIDEDTYHVIDYKTLRAYVRPEDLKQKIQPRAYALAAQIKWPKAKRIWVSFDMLRHDGQVGTVFSREENAETYRYLRRAAERIISIDEDKTVATINPECKWCIKKTTCNTLLRANKGGSSLGLTIEEIAARKLEIGSQLQALKYADEELEKLLIREAEARDEFEFYAGENKIVVSSRSMRKPNSNGITQIVGPELTAKYGNWTVSNVDKMLASGELAADQAKLVKDQISKTWGDPRAKVMESDSF